MDHIPATRLSVLKEAASGEWAQFWTVYLQPCLRELTLELRRCGLNSVRPEELLSQLHLALARSAKHGEVARRELTAANSDFVVQGNVPAKHLRLVAAASEGYSVSVAKFRTLLRRIISRLVLDAVRTNRSGHAFTRPNLDSPLKAVDEPDGSPIDDWADQLWIVDLLRATCQAFFSVCDASRTKGRRRFPRLLYDSLVDECSPQEIALREGYERSWISRQLAAAEALFASCLKHQYREDERHEVQRVLSDQTPGLIREIFQQEYDTRYDSCLGLPVNSENHDTGSFEERGWD